LVTPVLDQGASSVMGVFPGLVEGTDVYYDWYTQAPVAVPTSKNTTIAAPLGHIPVFVRGGAVLALQQPAMTTAAGRQTPWSLIVAPGVDGSASGSVYLDDGESITPKSTKMVTFSSQMGSIKAIVIGSFTGLDTPLANITILGVAKKPASDVVKINGKQVATSVWDASSQTLFIGKTGGNLVEKAWAGNWTLT
jgi:alpha-glucosidase